MSETQNPWIGYDRFGSFAEWYRNDDENSGYGANPERVRWYGSHQEVRDRAKLPPPDTGWEPIGADRGMPPYDAATATGMYDQW